MDDGLQKTWILEIRYWVKKEKPADTAKMQYEELDNVYKFYKKNSLKN